MNLIFQNLRVFKRTCKQSFRVFACAKHVEEHPTCFALEKPVQSWLTSAIAGIQLAI